ADSPLEIATVDWTTDQLCAWRVLEAAATGLRARSIAAAMARLKPDVVLYPQQSMFPKSAPCPSVLVVHDLFHLVCPQYLTATQPHKNHERLFTSIAELRASGSFPYHLLLTGARTPHWRHLRRLRRRLQLQKIVSHLGYVSYDMVLRLIRGAECVVFPSGFEG